MHAIAPFHLVAFYNETGESLSLGENPFRRGIREAFVDKLDAMRMFVRVVDRGSFSAVAKELGIGQPAVSKQISALENELGAQLIHRSSRAITLTEAGRDFYASALHILDDFENATSRIGRGQTAPRGLIRITVPPTFARLHMVSKLPSFFAAYPDMAVEMAASESPTTIIEDGFDLAIHSGDLPDSNLVARKFAQTMIILVATPQYLTRYGSPESPDDLTRHRAVVFVERGSVQPWTFASKRVIPTGVFRTSDIEQMRMGVLEHLGIAQAPAWLFAAELREGTAIRLLTPFERTVPILALRPASRRLSAKVRIFIEHLEKTFALCSQFNPRPS
jgi:DNA-binding transcriptional LysR family regulator